MKSLFFVLLFSSLISNGQDLNEIRSQYLRAVENVEVASTLNDKLSAVRTENTPVLQAYKGAVLTLMAKFSKSKSDKKEFFREGTSLIEKSINIDPDNLEIRYLRFGVQENSPRFLGYHKNTAEDKEFILEHYSSISSEELKEIIKDFVLKSKSFNSEEKGKF